MSTLKIGIIAERKNPPDTRVAITPAVARKIIDNYPYMEILVEPSDNRCFSDEEYEKEGIKLSTDMANCDVLIGVKEVPINQLISNKTYFFFSHTIKEQVYNRDLLKALVKKNIKMIDYEVLTDTRNSRVIAFGKFAGMVGAHNAVYTYQQRMKKALLKRMKDYTSYSEAKSHYNTISPENIRIVLTGTGRVGHGAALVLEDMGYRKVGVEEFLNNKNQKSVFVQLGCQDYVKRISDNGFSKSEFFENPKLYKSDFKKYLDSCDVFVNGVYWDNEAPTFFDLTDMDKPYFNIQVIADITCDIAPISSVPSTIRPSTIEDPIYGFDPKTNSESAAFDLNNIDVMAIDNLPNELPRDASESFAHQFYTHVMEELDNIDNSIMLANATVTERGDLGMAFEYLRDFLNG